MENHNHICFLLLRRDQLQLQKILTDQLLCTHFSKVVKSELHRYANGKVQDVDNKTYQKKRWMAILKNNIDREKFAKKTKDNKECNVAEFIKKVIDSKSYVYNKKKVMSPVQSHIQVFNKRKRQKEKKRKKKKRKREKRIANDNSILHEKRDASNMEKEIDDIDFMTVFEKPPNITEKPPNITTYPDCLEGAHLSCKSAAKRTYERAPDSLQTRNDNGEAAFLLPLRNDNSDDDMSFQNDGNNSDFFFNFNDANTEENVLQLDEVNLLSNEVLGELMSVQEVEKNFEIQKGKDSPTSVQQLPHTS